MANTLRIKRSNTATVTPISLLEGELAANIIDKKIWIGSSSQVPILISDINGSGGGIALTDISSSAVGLNYDYTTGNFSTSEGYEIPLTSTLSSITTAYNDRLQWDGSATSLITETGRTSLGINAVENTALSTWAGSTNITTVGAVTTKNLTIAPISQSATTASKCLTVTAPAHSNLTAGSECIDIDINLARTVSFAWAQTPLQKGIRIQAPTYSIVGSNMAGMTGAATVHIDSAPIAGTSINLSYSYALRVLTGTTAGHGITVLGANGQTGNLFQAQVYSTNFINFANVFTISSNGNVFLGPTGTAAGSTNNLHFQELAANGSQSVGFKAPDSIASTVIWTLPAADGTAGQVLSTNASGILSWATPSSGGSSVTTSATAPATPTAGNQWYDTTTGIIYTYVNDGTSSQWVQGSTATIATGVPAGGTTNQFLVKSSATDYATAWTGTLTNPTFTNYTETMFEVSGSGAWSINLSQGTIQKFYYNGNFTLTLPASVAGKSFVIIVQYQTNGLSTTWSSSSPLKWVGGITPTATGVSGKIDIYSFFQDGTNTYGTVYGQNF